MSSRTAGIATRATAEYDTITTPKEPVRSRNNPPMLGRITEPSPVAAIMKPTALAIVFLGTSRISPTRVSAKGDIGDELKPTRKAGSGIHRHDELPRQ